LLLAYSFITRNEILQKFYITFLIILIPFLIVNGILTGSFIEGEVVWYNNEENLGIRLFTIPIEDVFYAFSMLFANLILIEKFKLKFNNE
jgi:lycopene cyclase domain-containing protein